MKTKQINFFANAIRSALGAQNSRFRLLFAVPRGTSPLCRRVRSAVQWSTHMGAAQVFPSWDPFVNFVPRTRVDRPDRKRTKLTKEQYQAMGKMSKGKTGQPSVWCDVIEDWIEPDRLEWAKLVMSGVGHHEAYRKATGRTHSSTVCKGVKLFRSDWKLRRLCSVAMDYDQILNPVHFEQLKAEIVEQLTGIMRNSDTDATRIKAAKVLGDAVGLFTHRSEVTHKRVDVTADDIRSALMSAVDEAGKRVIERRNAVSLASQAVLESASVQTEPSIEVDIDK